MSYLPTSRPRSNHHAYSPVSRFVPLKFRPVISSHQTTLPPPGTSTILASALLSPTPLKLFLPLNT